MCPFCIKLWQSHITYSDHVLSLQLICKGPDCILFADFFDDKSFWYDWSLINRYISIRVEKILKDCVTCHGTNCNDFTNGDRRFLLWYHSYKLWSMIMVMGSIIQCFNSILEVIGYAFPAQVSKVYCVVVESAVVINDVSSSYMNANLPLSYN